MVEDVDDGTGQLTLSEPDGPGFWHVAVANGQVTVACSTTLLSSSCFDALSGVAYSNPKLGDTLRYGDVLTMSQRHGGGDLEPEFRTITLPENWPGSDVGHLITANVAPQQLAVIRVDIGDLSWQWDDLASERWPERRAFGGLAAPSSADGLTEVMAHVGDSWVQEHLDELRPAIARMLGTAAY